MNREEAIKILEYPVKKWSMEWDERKDGLSYYDALGMAISALRQQGVPYKDVGTNDPLTLDDAIAHLDDTLSDTGRKWSCESCRMEHVQLRAWLAELRDIKQKRNAPLTLDELRQMDGQPVYCVEITGREEWLFRRDGGFADMYGEFTSDDFMSWDNYGKLWWCYRQKPEED